MPQMTHPGSSVHKGHMVCSFSKATQAPKSCLHPELRVNRGIRGLLRGPPGWWKVSSSTRCDLCSLNVCGSFLSPCPALFRVLLSLASGELSTWETSADLTHWV